MSTRFQQSSPHIPRTKGAPFAILSSSVGKDFHKEGLMMRQFPYSTKTRDALGNPCFGGARIESVQAGGSQPPSTAPPLPRSSSSCSNVSLSRRSLHNLTTSPPPSLGPGRARGATARARGRLPPPTFLRFRSGTRRSGTSSRDLSAASSPCPSATRPSTTATIPR